MQSITSEVPEEKPLTYKTIDEGFDVWFVSTRGTTYSDEHEFLDPTSQEYWSFSFAEIGTQDVKSTVDLVYNSNGGKKIYLIGQSNGSTANHYGLST